MALLWAFTSTQARQNSLWANTVLYSLFFEELTNPEGPYRLQPERVRFDPDDYPRDAPLYGTRVLGTPIGHDAFVESYLHNFIDVYKYSFYRASSHIITT